MAIQGGGDKECTFSWADIKEEWDELKINDDREETNWTREKRQLSWFFLQKFEDARGEELSFFKINYFKFKNF